MDLKMRFHQVVKQKQLFTKDDRLLIAVSGGMDSMALLHLIAHLPADLRPFFAVAYVHHNLRPETEQEFIYVKQYCEEYSYPFYYRKWQEADQITTNVEAQAREFRYHFFAEIMNEQNLTKLITAHHADDQLETVLMKGIKGSVLKDLQGIRWQREINGISVIRPLLQFSKAELKHYVESQHIRYFEDSSNQDLRFMRNRLRHEFIPKLKQENPQILSQLQQFTKQINYADLLIQEQVQAVYEQIFKAKAENSWNIDLDHFCQQSEALQYFLLQTFWEKTLLAKGVHLSATQHEQALALLNQEQGQQTLDLAKHWQLVKSYHQAVLKRKVAQKTANLEQIHLEPGQGYFLSEKEWLGCLTEEQFSEMVPQEIQNEPQNWWRHELTLPENTLFPLTIRHKKPGDRFVYNQAGQHKKINRIFIDRKIPQMQREKAWVVADQKAEILWLIPYQKSYLSIHAEPVKIQYKLIYFLKNE